MSEVLRSTDPSSEFDTQHPSPPSPPPPARARSRRQGGARHTHCLLRSSLVAPTLTPSTGRPHTHIALQTRVQRQNELLGDLPVTILASSITLGAAETDWRDDALCRETDPELFFPVGTTGNALVQIDNAKEVCGECPSARGCLDFALDTNQDSGIWGGLTEEERRVIRRKRVAAARAARAAVG